MAIETTPLGFQKPDGNEPFRQGNDVISANAQKAQDLHAEGKARLALLEQSAGFPGNPIELADDVVSLIVRDEDSDTRHELDELYRPEKPYISVDDMVQPGDATIAVAWQRAVDLAKTTGIKRIVAESNSYVFGATGVNFGGLHGCTIEGLGKDSTIITGTSNLFVLFYNTSACSKLTFKNLGFVGPGVDDATGPRRSRTTTGPSFRTAIKIQGDLHPTAGVTYEARDILIENCKFVGLVEGLPIYFSGTRGYSKLTNSLIENCLDPGWIFYENGIATNNVSRRSMDNGFSLSRGGVLVRAGVRGCLITGNTIINPGSEFLADGVTPVGTTTVQHNFGTNVLIGTGYPQSTTNNVRSTNNLFVDLRLPTRMIYAANNASNSTFYSQGSNWGVGNSQILTETAKTIAGSVQTFTGGLSSGSNSATVGDGYYMQVNGPASVFREYRISTAGSQRWSLGAGNAGETGSDVGSDFYLRSYTDAGVLKSTVMRFSRDGKMAFNGATPVARPTLPAAATDLATTIALTNAMRTALINVGLAA
ncbi:hypothetical protein GCM10010052_17190 [Paenarthrobacter histidinolovorans]|nr:hypothetical protein GCM10010052_17190 [Paenarthrobacter histidinolovorans]